MRRAALVLCALGCFAAAPAPAGAADTTIDGTPLNVVVSDDGGIQGRFDGETANVFYPPDGTVGGAGFVVGIPSTVGDLTADDAFGPSVLQSVAADWAFTPVSQGAVTGAGTALSPFTVITVYKVEDQNAFADWLQVTQTVEYVNGRRNFAVHYQVANVTGGVGGPGSQSLPFRASVGGDLYVQGSDVGRGVFDSGPPRLVTGVGGDDADDVNLGGIEENTTDGLPWSAYQEAEFSTIFDAFAAPSGTGLASSVEPSAVDNGVGVQWSQHETAPLADGATTNFEVTWRFDRASLVPSSTFATGQTGEIRGFDVTAVGFDGSPMAGATIRYTILGGNPGGGTVTTNGSGQANVSWAGANAGVDELITWVDDTNPGVRDVLEPRGRATVEWSPPPGVPPGGGGEPPPNPPTNPPDPPAVGLPAPVLQKTANASRIRGRVCFRRPRTRACVPLTGNVQIPIGSYVDTTRGEVAITTAVPSRATQTANFYGGAFVLSQARNGLTTLALSGPSRATGCGARRLARAARAGRRLWGRGRGRFRTRGRHSAATVRGTTWAVTDRCDGTLTKVAQGSVTVEDFGRRRKIVVRAPRSYLARSRR